MALYVITGCGPVSVFKERDKVGRGKVCLVFQTDFNFLVLRNLLLLVL